MVKIGSRAAVAVRERRGGNKVSGFESDELLLDRPNEHLPPKQIRPATVTPLVDTFTPAVGKNVPAQKPQRDTAFYRLMRQRQIARLRQQVSIGCEIGEKTKVGIVHGA